MTQIGNCMAEIQKVLIVEDDHDIAETLVLFYRHNAFEVRHVDDGAQVIDAVRSFKPDLILLDVMIPNKSGVDCCQDIRGFSNVPIIMLTAKVQQTDKYMGLEAGADDYVCKPFDVNELILRSKALLKRTQGSVNFSSITVIKEQAKILYQDTKIELSIIEFNLFYLLYNSPDRIYSREQILQQAYPQERHITDRTIDSHVKKIRNKFKEAGIDVNPIESVYGAGYRFALN